MALKRKADARSPVDAFRLDPDPLEIQELILPGCRFPGGIEVVYDFGIVQPQNKFVDMPGIEGADPY